MCKLICITNRRLCGDGFLLQIEKIAAAKPDCIILREKDLDEKAYSELALRVSEICGRYDVPFSAHYFYKAAIRPGIRRIHLPLYVLRQMSDEEKNSFSVIGVSCHSADEAREAQRIGASYITAGHIYRTDCKSGLEGRGLDFLREVKNSVDIPVFAIGGISAENAAQTLSAGADGLCIMSGFMNSSDPGKLTAKLREVTGQDG